jgi:hypothetical protein
MHPMSCRVTPGGLGVFTVSTIEMTSPYHIVLNRTTIPERPALSGPKTPASRMLVPDRIHNASRRENIPTRQGH